MTDDEKEMAAEKALQVSAQIESENKIETLVKAKGFTECLAYVDDGSARVIVQTDGLTAEDRQPDQNIIVEETGPVRRLHFGRGDRDGRKPPKYPLPPKRTPPPANNLSHSASSCFMINKLTKCVR